MIFKSKPSPVETHGRASEQKTQQKTKEKKQGVKRIEKRTDEEHKEPMPTPDRSGYPAPPI